MKRRIAVRAVIIHEGKMLATWLKPYRGQPNDYWCVPGGGIDEGESLHTAVEREVMEELGVKPEIGNLLFIQQFATSDTNHLEFFFHVTNTEDFLEIDLTATENGDKEIEKLEFIQTSESTVLPDFLTSIDFENFDPNGPAQVFDFMPTDQPSQS